MKNYVNLTILILLLPIVCIAQNWTCIKGEKRSAGLGQYDTKGNSSLPTKVSARNLATGCMINNEYYLFGGFGFNSHAKKTPLNDFWKYDLGTHQWIWISGDTDTQKKQRWNFENKIIDRSVNPSPRSGSCSWYHDNKFYLFGGSCMDEQGRYNVTNQLWYYDFNKSAWIFIGDDTISNATTQTGITSHRMPSAREKSACWQWHDKVFILGGNGINRKGANTQLTDFWSYDLKANKWEQIYADSSEYQSQLLAFSKKNDSHPIFLQSACTWMLDNYLILYGGLGYNDEMKYVPTSDMWIYDIINGKWKKIGMDSYKNLDLTKERYNTMHPGVRSNAMAWTYNNRIYLFGGISTDSKGTQGMMNDLWNYDFEKNKWTRMDGNQYNEVNAPVHFDHTTLLETDYSPGARINALAFTTNHELYLFGGVVKNEYYADLYNDFWKYPIPIEEQNATHNTPIGLLFNTNPVTNVTTNIVEANSEAPISNADVLVSDDLYFTPNPVLDKASIYSTNLILPSSYEILNQNGIIMQSGTIAEVHVGQKYTIDVSGLSKANYFFKLKNSKGERTIYFSKN